MNICFVHAGWMRLVAVMQSHAEDATLPTGWPSNFGDSVLEVVESLADKYNKPAFTAAFILTPTFRPRIAKVLASNLGGELKSMFKTTVDVLACMARRWKLPDTMCENGDELLEDVRSVDEDWKSIMSISIMNYLESNTSQSSVARLSPADWWAKIYVPDDTSDSLELGFLAAKLLSVVPSGADVERCHKSFKYIHTDTRSRLEADRVDDLVRLKEYTRMKAGGEKRAMQVKGDDEFFNMLLKGHWPISKEMETEALVGEEARASQRLLDAVEGKCCASTAEGLATSQYLDELTAEEKENVLEVAR